MKCLGDEVFIQVGCCWMGRKDLGREGLGWYFWYLDFLDRFWISSRLSSLFWTLPLELASFQSLKPCWNLGDSHQLVKRMEMKERWDGHGKNHLHGWYEWYTWNTLKYETLSQKRCKERMGKFKSIPSHFKMTWGSLLCTRKMMAFAGISDCFTCSCGHTRSVWVGMSCRDDANSWLNLGPNGWENPTKTGAMNWHYNNTFGEILPPSWLPWVGHLRSASRALSLSLLHRTTANFAKATFEALKARFSNRFEVKGGNETQKTFREMLNWRFSFWFWLCQMWGHLWLFDTRSMEAY